MGMESEDVVNVRLSGLSCTCVLQLMVTCSERVDVLSSMLPLQLAFVSSRRACKIGCGGLVGAVVYYSRRVVVLLGSFLVICMYIAKMCHTGSRANNIISYSDSGSRTVCHTEPELVTSMGARNAKTS